MIYIIGVGSGQARSRSLLGRLLTTLRRRGRLRRNAHTRVSRFQTANTPDALVAAALTQHHSFPRRVGARVFEFSPPQRGVGGAPTGAPVQRHRLARNDVAGRAPSGVPASL